MLIKYYDPNIDRELFTLIWLEYTVSRLRTCRINAHFNIRAFISSADMMPTNTREYNVMQLVFARMDEKIGRNNPGIRKYKTFKGQYLSEINEIWADYYRGIRGCELPYDGKNRFKKFSYWDFTQETRALRVTQLFFIKHSGKDIKRLLKTRYKAIAEPILNMDFDAFQLVVNRIFHEKRFHYFHNEDLKFVFK